MQYDFIMSAVQHHHECVENLGYVVVMTSLIGSQNYGLDDEHSDIDTFSLIMPTFEDLALAREPKSSEFEVEDGKCMYKDIRLALNLLKKASPNSIEIFTSYFIYINPQYRNLINSYLKETSLNMMIHCNYSHMLYACAGMTHQLTKRNMPAGKRYSHAMRLEELVSKYCDYTVPTSHLLKMTNTEEALAAKRNTLGRSDEWYNKRCEDIALYLDIFKNNFELGEKERNIEKFGNNLIINLQYELMTEYLHDILK